MRLKAAEGRYFLPTLIFLLENLVSCTSEHDKKRLNSLKALQRAYEVLDNWVGDASAIVFRQEVRKHLLLYQELSEECGGEVFWHLYQKHHIMCHIADRGTNPKHEWNYRDESEIGSCVAVAKKCNQTFVHLALLRRYTSTWAL